jgi:hypothetical protein
MPSAAPYLLLSLTSTRQDERISKSTTGIVRKYKYLYTAVAVLRYPRSVAVPTHKPKRSEEAPVSEINGE